jgi:phenylalanyl-tRNA synthetase beta chain
VPTITLNKDVFERLVGKKLPLDRLKDRISMLGTDLEGIEGDKIHVEIFPNRPDLLSEQGFARAFAAFIGARPGLRKYDVKRSGEKVIVDKAVAGIRPSTACAIVKGLRLDHERIREIIQIQEKLHVTFCRNRKKAAIGIYPLEKIRMPIRYTALRPQDIRFRPLEGAREMTGLEVLDKHPAGKEYAHLLDGLDRFPAFLDDAGKVLSMPPIINSHDVGKVIEGTKDVFVECSGSDLRVLQRCLAMVVTALADMGGSIHSMDVVYDGKPVTTPDLSPRKMKLDLAYANRLLGLSLKAAEAGKLLERMGFGWEKGSVLIPAWRADILHQADLVEDIAIAYGYENFEEILPAFATIGAEDPFEAFRHRVARLMAGLGLLETSTYHLIDKEVQTTWMGHAIEAIQIVDPVSLEYNSLRAWMIPSLLAVLRENKHHEYPQRIYEMGAVFRRETGGETGIAEAVRLCALSSHAQADFTEMRQVLDYLLRALDLPYTVEEAEHASFLPGRVARVSVAGKKVAYVGELHPAALARFGLEMPTCALELNLTELFGLLEKHQGR